MKMKNSVIISHTTRAIKAQDDLNCKQKQLTAMDFVFWWDDNLMCDALNVRRSAFDMILFLCEHNLITHSIVRNPFRLSCLVYHKFVNIQAATINSLRVEEEEYIKTHKQEENTSKSNSVCYSQYFKYDHYQCNKKIFGYLKSQGISSCLVSELLARGFLGFDEKFNNLVFISRTMQDSKGIEKHGITSKHFMRLEGCSYPFVFWKDTGENYDPTEYYRVEFYSDTIEMLIAISKLQNNFELNPNVLYCSLHTANYNTEAISNLLLDYQEMTLHYNFDNPKLVSNVSVNTSLVELEKNHVNFTNEQIIEILTSSYNEEFSFDGVDEKTGLRKFTSANHDLFEDGEENLPF